MKYKKLFLILTLVLGFIVFLAPRSEADENRLSQLWIKVLNNPKDLNYNLSYAELAEKLGFYDKALLTYERILFFFPLNKTAALNVRRLKDLNRPDKTYFTIILSGEGSTNAAQSGDNKKFNIAISEMVSIVDERKIFNKIIKSNIVHLADAHTSLSNSDIIYNKIETGPQFYLTSDLIYYPSLSLEFVHIDQNFNNHSFEFNNNFLLNNSVFSKLWISYKNFSSHQENNSSAYTFKIGSQSDFDTHHIVENSSSSVNIIGEFNDYFNGFDNFGFRENYGRIGLNVKGSLALRENLTTDLSFNLSQKHYFNYDIVEVENRNDFNINASIGLEFSPNIIKGSAIFLFYNIERNYSNDNNNRFLNNSINASFLYSF